VLAGEIACMASISAGVAAPLFANMCVTSEEHTQAHADVNGAADVVRSRHVICRVRAC
jgi:hypothetical protein